MRTVCRSQFVVCMMMAFASCCISLVLFLVLMADELPEASAVHGHTKWGQLRLKRKTPSGLNHGLSAHEVDEGLIKATPNQHGRFRDKAWTKLNQMLGRVHQAEIRIKKRAEEKQRGVGRFRGMLIDSAIASFPTKLRDRVKRRHSIQKRYSGSDHKGNLGSFVALTEYTHGREIEPTLEPQVQAPGKNEIKPPELPDKLIYLEPQNEINPTELQDKISHVQSQIGIKSPKSQSEISHLEPQKEITDRKQQAEVRDVETHNKITLQPDNDKISSNLFSRERREASEADLKLPSSLPKELRRAVVQVLYLDRHWSQSRQQGGEVELSCRNDAMKLFKQEVPMLKIKWLLNGDPLKVQASRMLFSGDDVLVVQDLRISDTGVYECRAEYNKKRAAVTVGVFALTVTTNNNTPTLVPRETEPLTLACHSEQLAAIMYSVDLTIGMDPDFGCKGAACEAGANVSQLTWRQWFHNGTGTKHFSSVKTNNDLIPAGLASPEIVKESTRDLSGVWYCLVTHERSRKEWNTSWYRVFVKDPPSNLELLWRYLLHKPWLVSISITCRQLAILLLGTCIALSILVARKAQKADEDLERRWQVTKTRMMSRSSRLLNSISLTSQNSMEQMSEVGDSEIHSASMDENDDLHMGPYPETSSRSGSRHASRAHHSIKPHETRSLINKERGNKKPKRSISA